MKKRRKAAPPRRTLLRKLEWIGALLVAALIVVLHCVNLTHAGGLWRDEAAAVNLALFPSLGEIWSHIEHESFPLLLTVLLRGWNTMGLGDSDLALRVFGMLVGLAMLAVLWWNAWQFSASPISMLLLGLSGTTIRWGDSLRAYGLGVLFLLLALGLIWKIVRSPSWRTVIIAMVASVLAVQALYQSIFMLAAFCLAGVVVAVAIDALIARILRDDWTRMFRLGAVVILAGILTPSLWQRASVRMTNLDLVAQRLNQEAGKEDLILMHPWFCGVTFDRYYKGGAEWLTLPPLADRRLQRLDLFKEQMQLETPIQPVLEKVEATLRSGHVVWLVGYYPFSNPPRPPPKMPRPCEGPAGWNEAPYMTAYGMEVAYFLQAHAGESTPLNLDIAQAVNPFENFPIRAVTGWRSSRF